MPLAAHGGAKSSGATRLDHRWGRVASNCRAVDAMDSDANDFAETDADILTFDVPDEALERAAGCAALVLTLALCTNDWYQLHVASIATAQ